MKFDCKIGSTIRVDFEEPEKARAVFIDGDWKDCFYELEDLEEAAKHLAFAFNNVSEYWDSKKSRFCKDIEGFGTFIIGLHNLNIWTGCEGGEAGAIRINVEEPIEVYEVEEVEQ